MSLLQNTDSASIRLIESQERELARGLSDEWFIRLHQVKAVQINEQHKLAHQLSRTFVLIIAVHGAGRLYLDDHQYLLEPNTYGFCPPGHTWGAHSDDQPLKLFQFQFHLYQKMDSGNAALAPANANALPMSALQKESKESESNVQPWLSQHGALNKLAGSQLQQLCESIAEDWENPEPFARFHANLNFQRLMYAIWTNSRSAKRSSKASMEQVKQYIEQNYASSLTIDHLAQLAGVSSNYFVDLFKKTFGISAMEYAAEWKMTQAKRHMARGSVKLKEIAAQVGYEDEFYFSRKFKKHTGMSPTQYMAARKRKIAAYTPSVSGHLLALNRIPYAAPMHPKWTEYYYLHYRSEIPVHLSAYRHNVDWSANVERLMHSDVETLICIQPLRREEETMLREVIPDLLIVPEQLDWHEQFLRIAHYLGDDAEVESWLSRYNEKVQWGQAQLRQNGVQGSMLILRIFKNKLYLNRNRGTESVLVDALGFTPVPILQQLEVLPGQSREVTLEQIAEIDPEYLFMLICQETETLAYWDELQTTEAWQGLQAVRSGHLLHLSSDPWKEYSAYSQLRKIDEAVKLFSVHNP